MESKSGKPGRQKGGGNPELSLAVFSPGKCRDLTAPAYGSLKSGTMAKIKSRLQMWFFANPRSGESRSEYENPLEGNLRAGSIPALGTTIRIRVSKSQVGLSDWINERTFIILHNIHYTK